MRDDSPNELAPGDALLEAPAYLGRRWWRPPIGQRHVHRVAIWILLVQLVASVAGMVYCYYANRPAVAALCLAVFVVTGFVLMILVQLGRGRALEPGPPEDGYFIQSLRL